MHSIETSESGVEMDSLFIQLLCIYLQMSFRMALDGQMTTDDYSLFILLGEFNVSIDDRLFGYVIYVVPVKNGFYFTFSQRRIKL